MQRVVDGGTLVVSADHDGARELVRRLRATPRAGALTIRTYGVAEDADVRVLKITPRGLASEVTVVLDGEELTFDVSVPGAHYALNAVAALTAGAALGVPAAELGRALGSYTGVKRRLQLKGLTGGVQVIDSYAHHPTEMTADLEAIRGGAEGGRVLVVFQPHLFSRTQELGKEMGEALSLADGSVVLPIYLPGARGPHSRRDQRADHRRRTGGGRRRAGHGHPGRGGRGGRGNGGARRSRSHHGRG